MEEMAQKRQRRQLASSAKVEPESTDWIICIVPDGSELRSVEKYDTEQGG